MKIDKDTLIFLVPLSPKEIDRKHKRYAQFSYRPAIKMQDLLKALNIPFETSYEAFKGVKTIPADRQELTAYRIDVKTKGNIYEPHIINFTSNIIDKVLDYYEVEYIKDNNIYKKIENKEIQKETDKDMNYAKKQKNAKLENWYICHKLNIKMSTWTDIRQGRRNLAADKLDKFLELVDPKRKEWLEQDSAAKKIDTWYKENPDMLKTLMEEFNAEPKSVAADIGIGIGTLYDIKNNKNLTLQAKYLIYYYFADENNKRNKKATKKGKRGRPATKKKEVTKVEYKLPKYVEEYAKEVEENNKELEKEVEASTNVLEALKNKESEILWVAKKEYDRVVEENNRKEEELARYKYLIDLAMQHRE